ncbi:hypothetical protein [Clostridium rectalis]|uniref:hypothetical protein n=1 Tax=Clostridium rectalis TaxID=2040295 RepID=UPI000F643C16|nr:hypothetical protein [Clostridium rectalis]
MDKFQRGLLAINAATLLIFIIYTLVNENKSSKWFKWYNQMDCDEQKKYNPIIAVHKLKRMLFIILLVGTSGLLISFYIPSSSIVAFILIFIIFFHSIGYLGPRRCKSDKRIKYYE